MKQMGDHWGPGWARLVGSGLGCSGQTHLGLAKPSVQASRLGPWAQGADTSLPQRAEGAATSLALLNSFSCQPPPWTCFPRPLACK